MPQHEDGEAEADYERRFLDLAHLGSSKKLPMGQRGGGGGGSGGDGGSLHAGTPQRADSPASATPTRLRPDAAAGEE